MQVILRFFSKPIFSDFRFIFSLLTVLTLLISLREAFLAPPVDNFLAFKYSFFHLIENKNLYGPYPDEYKTYYNYGPFFATLMVIWAYFPTWLGVVLWNFWHLANYLIAIRFLPIDKKNKVFLYWFCLQELVTSLMNVQTNPTITALMMGFLILSERKQVFWAAGILVFGLFFKIYAVVVGALFILYPNKVKFIIFCTFWAVVFFILPLLFISWNQLLFLYTEWYEQLQSHSTRESMTVMGIFNALIMEEIPRIWIMGTGILLTCGIFFKVKYHNDLNFKLIYLASLLIFAVIFNPGSESPTYIIAVAGVALWYVVSPKTNWHLILLVLVFVFTCLSPTDIVPSYERQTFFEPYQVKAMPCVLVWLVIIYELYFYKPFETKTT